MLTSIGPALGPTLARTESGPTMNSGLGCVERNTCPCAAPGAATSSSAASSARLDFDRRELARVVLGERELLLDEAVLEQGVLHHAQRLDVDGAVDRQQRAGDLVGAEHGFGAPAKLLSHEGR